MAFALSMMQQMVCPVCEQPITEEDVHRGVLEGALFGWKAFGICPCCLQTVENNRNQSYRRRCLRYVKENLALLQKNEDRKHTQASDAGSDLSSPPP